MIGEVMVGLVTPLFRRIARDGRGRGGKRLVGVFERQLRALAGDPAFRRFLEHEREAAQRILTAPDGIVEPRVVELIKEAIDGEVARGYEPPSDPDVIAYAIVRMGESFLYADASRGFRGDFERLRAVYAALLGVKAVVFGTSFEFVPNRYVGGTTRMVRAGFVESNAGRIR